MKYLTFLAVSVLMFTWIACGHGRPYEASGSTETTTPDTPANSAVQPQTIPVNLNSQTAPSTVLPVSSTAPGMNPPHGQPGHRCDIAEGAPLNSAPAQPAAPAAITPVNISANQPAQSATTTTTAPGMNPAHGQPGHRCDIAVGAPLNSKPATNTATPVTISSDQPGKTVAATPTAPGMNPPHGQPGHRCEIAVGAPLDSKPTVVAGVPSTNTFTSSQSIPSVVPIKPLPDSSKQNP